MKGILLHVGLLYFINFVNKLTIVWLENPVMG